MSSCMTSNPYRYLLILCRIYDQDQLASMLREKGCEAEPEFFPPANKYYTHAAGEFTPYGHELFGLMASFRPWPIRARWMAMGCRER